MGADEESAGFARYSEHEWSDVRQANWVATRASRPGILRDGKPFWFPPSKKGGFFPMLDINLLRTNPELVKELSLIHI